MSQISNYTFDEISIGQTATYSRLIGEKEISCSQRPQATSIRCTWMPSSPPAQCSKSVSPTV
jgi:hypothetical protein